MLEGLYCTSSAAFTSRFDYPVFDYPVLEQKPKKEGEIMYLYDVFVVYGGDRNNIVIKHAGQVVAVNEEQAEMKLKVSVLFENGWDTDYISIICHNIGSCNVEEKPKKVININLLGK